MSSRPVWPPAWCSLSPCPMPSSTGQASSAASTSNRAWCAALPTIRTHASTSTRPSSSTRLQQTPSGAWASRWASVLCRSGFMVTIRTIVRRRSEEIVLLSWVLGLLLHQRRLPGQVPALHAAAVPLPGDHGRRVSLAAMGLGGQAAHLPAIAPARPGQPMRRSGTTIWRLTLRPKPGSERRRSQAGVPAKPASAPGRGRRAPSRPPDQRWPGASGTGAEPDEVERRRAGGARPAGPRLLSQRVATRRRTAPVESCRRRPVPEPRATAASSSLPDSAALPDLGEATAGSVPPSWPQLREIESSPGGDSSAGAAASADPRRHSPRVRTCARWTRAQWVVGGDYWCSSSSALCSMPWPS